MDVLDRMGKMLVWLLLLPLFPVFGVVPAGGGEPPEGDGDGDGESNGGDDGGDDDEGADDGRRYTQDEMNAAIQKRLARERKKAQAQADELERLRTAAARLEELEDAEKTEVERLRDEVGKLKGQLEGEGDSLTARREELKERVIRLEVRRAAVKLGFIDPDDAYLLADLSDVVLDEDTDEVTGVEKALKALVKDKSHLVKEEGSDPPASGKGTPPRGGRRKKGKREIPKPKIRM